MTFSGVGDGDYMDDSSDDWENKIFHPYGDFRSSKPQGSEMYWSADYNIKALAYQKAEKKSSEFPSHLIRNRDMKIKDVVKQHALPFLPAKSLTKFRAVSKEWDRWISSPLLAHQQSFTNQSFSGYFYQDMNFSGDRRFLSVDHSSNGVPNPSLSFFPENVKILSSCNGLLLCQGLDQYYVCNPATQDWKVLPIPHYYHGAEPAIVLVFEPSLRNIEAYYHVICAFRMLDQPIVSFEIYSSESNSWRCSSSDCTELENTSLVGGGGFYMNGVAYWETKSNEVLAFDVKNEIPAILSVPIHVGRHGTLTQMEGELCYVTANNECGNVFLIDIYGGMDMSLKRSVSINLGTERSFTQSCMVLPCVSCDAVVAIHTGRKIYIYNLREQKVEAMQSPLLGAVGSDIRLLPYINSLVMLHELKESLK